MSDTTVDLSVVAMLVLKQGQILVITKNDNTYNAYFGLKLAGIFNHLNGEKVAFPQYMPENPSVTCDKLTIDPESLLLARTGEYFAACFKCTDKSLLAVLVDKLFCTVGESPAVRVNPNDFVFTKTENGDLEVAYKK